MANRVCIGKAIPIAVLSIVFLIGISPIPTQADVPKVLQDLDQAMVQVAQNVTPAVVNISSTKKAAAGPGGEMGPFSKNFPFHDFFGDEFFKQFKQRPRPEGPPMRVQMGSGFIVSPDGIILTNAHVVKDMDDITVTLPGKRTYKAKLIGADPESDIAVIKIDAKGLPTAKFGDSSKLKVGEIVVAVGNPFGLNGTVTQGIVSATGRTNVGIIDYEDFIQTDAAINPGNSGGPLVNIQGDVIGVTTAIATRSGGYQGIGFAIPSNSAKLVMDEIMKEGKVTRGMLGVNIQDVNEALAKSFGRTDTNGALVSQVIPGSPAEKAGIKAGDIILTFNGAPITGASELKNLVGQTRPGSSAKLTIWRDKKSQDIALTVGERTPKALAEGAPSATSKAEASKELGVAVEPVPAELAKKLKLKEGVGLAIKEVTSGSVGSKMGLQEGDIILEIGGKEIHDVATLNQGVDEAKKSGVVRLMIQRGAATIYLAESMG